MKINSFAVVNYRSITETHKISLQERTVLIGKNNEGKSNLLKSLVVGMNLIIGNGKQKSRFISKYKRYDESIYIWERDFPINLREKRKPNTTFKFVFELDEAEIHDFKKEIKTTLNGQLPLNIIIGKDNVAEFKIPKTGNKASKLSEKSSDITNFIASRIYVNYIPAIRTDDDAIEVIKDMLSNELASIEDDEEYKQAIETIQNKQVPILESLSDSIRINLIDFLPNIKSVEIRINDEGRRLALRRDIQLIVDDGIPTEISFKGDGVKSLITLSLLKNKSFGRGSTVIAIEEPETHLHSGAIHYLNATLEQLADDNQIILSTHNPLFIDRNKITKNLLVEKGKVFPAKNVRQIRDLLGIKSSDNLTNANYILVVEGEDDKISLLKLLPKLSSSIKNMLDNNSFVIEEIGGAGNLSYKLQLYKSMICTYHVLLDNDDAGRKSRDKAISDGLLSIKNTTMTIVNGFPEAEFEDCFSAGVYKQMFLDKYGVDITRGFSGNKKWSDRMKNCFYTNSKPWDERIEKEVKLEVAKCIDDPINSLDINHKTTIDSLIFALEELLK